MDEGLVVHLKIAIRADQRGIMWGAADLMLSYAAGSEEMRDAGSRQLARRASVCPPELQIAPPADREQRMRYGSAVSDQTTWMNPASGNRAFR